MLYWTTETGSNLWIYLRSSIIFIICDITGLWDFDINVVCWRGILLVPDIIAWSCVLYTISYVVQSWTIVVMGLAPCLILLKVKSVEINLLTKSAGVDLHNAQVWTVWSLLDALLEPNWRQSGSYSGTIQCLVCIYRETVMMLKHLWISSPERYCGRQVFWAVCIALLKQLCKFCVCVRCNLYGVLRNLPNNCCFQS